MTNFIYKEIAHHNRKRNNREVTIYIIKHNKAEYVGTLEYSTGSTRGAQSEVFNFLMDHDYIPKKYYTSSECAWMGAGYFFGEVTQHYSIIEV